ncbi:hypothetical protein BDA99DRAFT_516362 [Phascolomyces articulosus]|uniref:Uncharacterized protein n=1 Tax=Phascolomyces articulosus TaxID=60185 RepID=A0AAD5K8Q4_9FUNG|nr:hypothetical protein BDA99DRAFT_516362 [Phascolomyces articulosus]
MIMMGGENIKLILSHTQYILIIIWGVEDRLIPTKEGNKRHMKNKKGGQHSKKERGTGIQKKIHK